ncbi:MFS transporter [Streptomyces sp. NPDC007095]|uniref:MFS transporter n=1 Tax=Streptomyces sp. NPDC007095 TaxID=3154482 RepID=UPI000C70EF0B
MNPSARRRLTLANSVVGAVIVALDGTVLTVAQPTLRRDLDASFAQVQWTSTGYLIAVAGLLVFAGRLGDRYGHQQVFAVGTVGFGAASAGIGLAPDIGWVTGLRVAQGVLLLGAGFVAVMVSATAVVVRSASAGTAGVAGGLQQTAMNIGPTVGVAVATTLVGLAGVDMGPALTVLAALTAVGALSALRLPGRGEAPVTERRPAGHPPGDAAREVRTRR